MTPRSDPGSTASERVEPRRPSDPAASAGVVVLVLLLALAVPLALTRHYGALGIPRSDDWSYLVTLFRLVDDGRLSFNHWVSMSLVGQLALASPLAAVADRSIAAQQVQTALIGVAGLGALAATARGLRVQWVGVLFVVGGIGFGPLWGSLAVSFMTDIPAFSASAIAVLLAVLAWRRPTPSSRLLVASVAVSVYAFTIRQYAVVPAIAVIVVAMARALAAGDRRTARRWLLGLAGVGLGAGAFLVWWQHIPDVRSLSPAVPTAHSVRTALIDGAGFLRVTALLCAPVLLWRRPWHRLRAAWVAMPVTTLVVTGVSALWIAVTALRYGAFVGNYLEPDGVLADIVLVGHRPDVLPGALWSLLVASTSVGAVALVVMTLPWISTLLRRPRQELVTAADPARTFLGVTVLGYGAAYLLAMLADLQVYDRYALPLGAGVALMLATMPAPTVDRAASSRREPARSGTAAASAALVVVALLGLAFTADSASFDGARWRVAQAAVRAGWPARTVNGGFEWRNWYRGDKLPALTAADPRGREQICITVHVDPRHVPGRVVAQRTSRAPTRKPSRLVAYRTATPCPDVRRTARP